MSRLAVLTGASSGIGARAATVLAERGWRLAIVGRNRERTERVAAQVGGTAYVADFDRLDDVRSLAERLGADHGRIDVLANNAGGLVSERGLSADGHELTLQRNHLAPFLLTALLSAQVDRVVHTASVANRFAQLRLDDLEWERRRWLGGWRSYGTSKLMTILFARELAARTAIESFSFHPGFVVTGFGADSRLMKLGGALGMRRSMITPEQGAQPLIELIDAEVVPAASGTYFDGLSPDGPTHRDDTVENARRVWEATERMVGFSPR